MINSRKKKWTLMFFFASDNVLSPSMLTQIKAIKAAGYQQDTNVLLHFDPNEKGAPTRVFEVNRAESRAGGPSRIGDTGGPLVSVLTGDDVTTKAFQGAKEDIDAMESKVALEKFLDTCREDYRADHYMLFLVGHGMVVGRDSFLPDENPVSAIGLVDLGRILNTFKDNAEGKLELIGMHSCSMSGVEISYQLQDTASFMLGSQGVSFVGAWPYRQMLITIYNAIEAERQNPRQPVSVDDLVEQLHDLSIQHSADFMVGGYSADLCLSTLKSTHVVNLDKPIHNLAEALRNGLKEPQCQELILLAHWKSQSYWQEMYTDLYDFCLCLRQLCLQHDAKRPAQLPKDRKEVRGYDATQKKIEEACDTVMQILKPKRPKDIADGPVVRADFIGAATQYSHGLSIYFPWTRPVQDKNEHALENYADYKFSSGPETKAWLTFLRSYFQETQRDGRISEDKNIKGQDASYQTPEFTQALDDAKEAFKVPGTPTGQPQSFPTALDGGKVIPPDSGGGGACACLSIKNYSPEFVMSFNASKVFGSGGPSARAAGAAVKQP